MKLLFTSFYSFLFSLLVVKNRNKNYSLQLFLIYGECVAELWIPKHYFLSFKEVEDVIIHTQIKYPGLNP